MVAMATTAHYPGNCERTARTILRVSGASLPSVRQLQTVPAPPISALPRYCSRRKRQKPRRSIHGPQATSQFDALLAAQRDLQQQAKTIRHGANSDERPQRHTLCWLESAELRLIARQLNGAFRQPPASLREELRTIRFPDISPASCAGASVMKRVFPGLCFPAALGKGSVHGWRRVASLQAVTRVNTGTNGHPACRHPYQRDTPPLAPRVKAWRGPETGLGVWGRWRWR